MNETFTERYIKAKLKEIAILASKDFTAAKKITLIGFNLS